MSDYPPKKVMRVRNNTDYRSEPPLTPRSAANMTNFVFDHSRQQRIVPKAAARSAKKYGVRTMNAGGGAAGSVNLGLVRGEQDG